MSDLLPSHRSVWLIMRVHKIVVGDKAVAREADVIEASCCKPEPEHGLEFKIEMIERVDNELG